MPKKIIKYITAKKNVWYWTRDIPESCWLFDTLEEAQKEVKRLKNVLPDITVIKITWEQVE